MYAVLIDMSNILTNYFKGINVKGPMVDKEMVRFSW